MKDEVNIYIIQNGVSYIFAKIKVVSDGSLEVIFPEIKESRGIKQALQISKQTPLVISSACIQQKDEKQCYISYHTSGKVNYHKMAFQSAFMEPLYNVREANHFFVYSFVHPEIAFKNSIEKVSSNAINVDISDFMESRINIMLSVEPADIQPKHNNSFVISYPLYSLCVEIMDDADSFNFAQIYKENECVKIRPRLDKYSEQHVTKEKAFLEYNHAIYQTKELIVLPPNGEGILKVIFTNEMRIPPWICVEFLNPNFKAEILTRKTTHMTFKVFDKKRSQYIKKADDIQITQVILDAEIYEDDSVPPPGCI